MGHATTPQTPTFRGYDSWYGGFLGGADHFTHLKTDEGCSGYDVRFCNASSIRTVWGKGGVFSTDLWTQEVLRVVQDHDISKYEPSNLSCSRAFLTCLS